MNGCGDKKEDDEQGMPILVISDHATKMKFAKAVPKKGMDPYAITRLKKILDS